VGYYIYLGDHEFTIQASQYDAILERWREFEERNGVAYPSDSVFYRYPEEDASVPLTVPDIFEGFGFEVVANDEAMTIDGWEGKAYREADYIRAIADLVDEGWYWEWTGEDDDRWRDTAEDTVSGETVFVMPNLEYRLRDLTKMLDEYDNAYPAQDYATLAEVSATGPIIDAVRALIKDLS
jgi:hypothetical protein